VVLKLAPLVNTHAGRPEERVAFRVHDGARACRWSRRGRKGLNNFYSFFKAPRSSTECRVPDVEGVV